MKIINILISHAKQIFKYYYLIIFLILLLVIQNHLFNYWLDIFPSRYIIRRTIVSLALGLLLFGPAVLMSKRYKYLYLSIISLVVSIFFITQYFYYSYSGGFLQFSSLFYADQGATILGTVKSLLTYKLFLFILAPLILLVHAIWDYRKKIEEKELSKRRKIHAGIMLLLATTFCYGYLFAREYIDNGNTVLIYNYQRLYDVNALVSKMGVVNYSIGDMLNYALTSDKASAAELASIKNFSNKNLEEKGKFYGLAKGRNLIFIQIESLDNTVINQKIEGQEITPNLNRLTKEGLYFSNYFAQIGPGTTADAEFSVQNSLYPLPNSVAFIKYPYNYYEALPKRLKESGYSSNVFHGDVLSFWNRANAYPGQGYENIYSKPDFVITRKVGPYDLPDQDFFDQSILKLKQMKQPFYSVLITLTSHTPFILPDDLNELSIVYSTELSWIQKGYLQSARYTDKAVGSFVEQLKSAGLYDNSVIIIYGDHGGFTNIASTMNIHKSIFFDIEYNQVPFIILAPKTKLNGEMKIPASHIDVYPTVANLLGIDLPSTTIFGQDLLSTKEPVVTYRNLISGTVRAVITDKFAYHSSSDGIFENGNCLELKEKKKVSVENCRGKFEEQNEFVEMSDLIIRNNLLESTKK